MENAVFDILGDMPDAGEEATIVNHERLQRGVSAQVLLMGVDASRTLLRPEVLGLCVRDNLVMSVNHLHALETAPILAITKAGTHKVVVQSHLLDGIDCAVYTVEGNASLGVIPHNDFRTEPLIFNEELIIISKKTFRTGETGTCVYFDPSIFNGKIHFSDDPEYTNNQVSIVLLSAPEYNKGDSGSIVIDKSGKIAGMLTGLSLYQSQAGDFQFGHMIPSLILQRVLSES